MTMIIISVTLCSFVSADRRPHLYINPTRSDFCQENLIHQIITDIIRYIFLIFEGNPDKQVDHTLRQISKHKYN